MEDLENTKNEIEVSFDDISEISEEVPEELREGHKELKDLINEGFGWFSSNNKKNEKIKTVQNMESNLENCKNSCQELNEELNNLDNLTEIYFEMLEKNLELQPNNLKIMQQSKIKRVKSEYDKIYSITKFKVEDLNKKVREFEGIVAYIRGDVALDLIEAKVFKELKKISAHSDNLVLEINENIIKGKKLISDL